MKNLDSKPEPQRQTCALLVPVRLKEALRKREMERALRAQGASAGYAKVMVALQHKGEAKD